jgi:hypothetical protein
MILKKLLFCWLLCTGLAVSGADVSTNRSLPVRGLCIAAPSPERVDEFIKFITEELATRSVNTLVLRVDYNFKFQSHPEVGEGAGLSKEDAKKLAAVCRKHEIRLIPLIDLLGHQSWQSQLGKLLKAHPEFDETPEIKLPEKYSWPNPDRLYCKSYCPRHPAIHDFVFGLVDEICDAFEADAFHAGMDEVFYLGEEQCPRCKGHKPGELFADEVRALRDHLDGSHRRLWIWGDRLLDGETTGLGEWEASRNNTYPAIDLIPKDVVICDWHYERPDPTAVCFAVKGLDVVACPWKNTEAAVAQVHDMIRFRSSTPPRMSKHFLGVMQTVWSGAGPFMDEFYGRRPARPQKNPEHTESKCFVRTFEAISKAE